MANWYDNIPAPVDANGCEVPLDTRELVYKGETRDVFRIAYSVAIGRWVADLANTDEHPFLTNCTLPDSWERLEKDAAKCACDYFGKVHISDCCSCPAVMDGDGCYTCYATMAQDIVNRAKALAVVDDDE